MIFAGNVDGVTFARVDGNHLVEKNLFLYHSWEDAVDVKAHWPDESGNKWSIIRNNVISCQHSRYSGITIQNSSDHIMVLSNVIRGNGMYCSSLWIHGRNNMDYPNTVKEDPEEKDPEKKIKIKNATKSVSNIEVIGNWLDYINPEGYAIRFKPCGTEKYVVDISDVFIAHNIISGHIKPLEIKKSINTEVFNNIFTNCGDITDFVVDTNNTPIYSFISSSNMFYNTALWGDNPIQSNNQPIYSDFPAGPLAQSSEGKNQAENLGLGHDVGLPNVDLTKLASLEIEILNKLGKIFTYEDIYSALQMGDLEANKYSPKMLLAHWPMDTVNSGKTTDLTANNCHAAVPANVTLIDGKVGNAMTFDGTTRLLPTNQNRLAIDGDLTIAAWVKTDNTEKNQMSLVYGAGWTTKNYQVDINQGVLQFKHANGASCFNYSSGVNVADGTWKHVAVSVNSTELKCKFYVDGQLVSSNDMMGKVQTTTANNTRKIGGSQGDINKCWVGSLDDIRIYKGALSAEVIQKLMTY
ncbi:MAG: LamG domain-containing protein [Lentisphaerae bacterium]|nr:LamG domain-containing protein [Lentisphaerota bacterium]MCP4103818.1 LamG domain-containing protein [Lentisphaerota bacterium]